MKKILVILVGLFSTGSVYSQADCSTSQPFCTSSAYSFPASTNTTAPTGPDYGCLGSQPNPAFYFMQIDQPGNLTITMQSTPLVDIDFICWGPFNDPATMCDSLTGAYIEDCSYSIAAVENCDIINAVTGQYYILLITNYSNQTCNIDFSLTNGNGTTSCCLLGDAGNDNTIDFCESAPNFIMEDQLLGSPNSGGVWFNDTWGAYGGNNYDPSLLVSGDFYYIVPGIPVPGSSVTCPDDTASLTININPDPIIAFPVFNEMCSDESPLNLNSATPIGGTYSGSGVSSDVFTPSSSVIGVNVITYDITDVNGCSDIATQNLIVNDVPLLSLGTDQTIPCRSTFLINPIITGGTAPYSYLWNDGSTSSDLTVSDGIVDLVITDVSGCIANDQVTITQDITPTTIISGGGEICNDGTMVNINFNFNGLLPWNLTYSDGSVNAIVSNINSPNYTINTGMQGDYEVILASDVNGCESDNLGGVVNLTVYPLPVAIITPSEITIYENEEINLTTGTYTLYEWYATNDSLISTEEVLTVTDSGSFYIWVEDENGCTDYSDIAIVNMVPITQLFVPNTFTPNGDEHNELFVIKGYNIITYNLKVFDKWGEQLYESDNIEKYWDGKYNNKQVQQDAYYYNIEVLGKDREIVIKTGTVNVVY